MGGENSKEDQPFTPCQISQLESTFKQNFGEFAQNQQPPSNQITCALKSYLGKPVTFPLYIQAANEIINYHPHKFLQTISSDPPKLVSKLVDMYHSHDDKLVRFLCNSINHDELDFSNKYLHTLWSRIFTNYFLDQPHLHITLDGKTDLLTWSEIFILELNIPDPDRIWKRVYSNMYDGSSWNRFSSKIQDAVIKSSLLLIKSKCGKTFGGYASTPWRPCPNFYGDSSCFLFDEYGVYGSTGLNDHYMFFNYGTKTLVNGIAFGGQFDYFTLFISSDFNHGHTRGSPSSTYGNESFIGGDGVFEIDIIEVWRVKEEEIDDTLIDKNQKQSILDNVGEMGFLELAGKKMYSKDLETSK